MTAFKLRGMPSTGLIADKEAKRICDAMADNIRRLAAAFDGLSSGSGAGQTVEQTVENPYKLTVAALYELLEAGSNVTIRSGYKVRISSSDDAGLESAEDASETGESLIDSDDGETLTLRMLLAKYGIDVTENEGVLEISVNAEDVGGGTPIVETATTDGKLQHRTFAVSNSLSMSVSGGKITISGADLEDAIQAVEDSLSDYLLLPSLSGNNMFVYETGVGFYWLAATGSDQTPCLQSGAWAFVDGAPHSQNSDTILDEGNDNEVSAEEIRADIDGAHDQDTDQYLDYQGTNEVSAADLHAFLAAFPTPPSSGTYFLRSVDGTLSWFEAGNC